MPSSVYGLARKSPWQPPQFVSGSVFAAHGLLQQSAHQIGLARAAGIEESASVVAVGDLFGVVAVPDEVGCLVSCLDCEPAL